MSPKPVVVVGTIFVDLKCFPQNELNFKGRNLGRAEFYHGGVGRNVAETMALLGSRVRFCSSVHRGGIGAEVLARLESEGVDTTGVHQADASDAHGMWVAILHPDGDLACSISQMPDVLHMHRAWTAHSQAMLSGAGLVVLELDLTVEMAADVLADARRAGVPVVGLPGNFDCIRRRPDLLEGLHAFVCNQYEAAELFGKPVASLPAASQAAKAIVSRGVRQAVVTLGALGAVAAGQGEGEPFYVPALPVEVVDTTGAGDSFVAGLSHALSLGADLRLTVEAAARVAAWTVSASEGVCRDLPRRIEHDLWDGWNRLRN